MKKILFLLEIKGVSAVAEEITIEGLSHQELLRAIAVRGPGSLQRGLLSPEEATFLKKEGVPFGNVAYMSGGKGAGVFFLYRSSGGGIISILSAKESATEADCPLLGLTTLMGIKKGDVFITKVTSP